jgi:ornithine cyclodeaminase/alanine dehydrogenase-like protein (mu-crystallin family)
MLKCLSEDAIKAAVSVKDAMASQREAFIALESNKVTIPERIIASTSYGSTLFKPFLTEQSFGLKVVSVREGRERKKMCFFNFCSFFNRICSWFDCFV